MRFNPFANLSLKLISLFIAIFLWFIMSGGSRSVMDFRVPLQLIGLPEGLAIAGEYPDTIDIRVQGPDILLGRLTEAQINIIVDLSKVTIGEQLIPITPDLVRLPVGASAVKFSPSQIRLRVEKKIQGELPVVPSVVGNTPPGFSVRSVSVSPEKIKVEGAESEVLSLDQVLTAPVSVVGRKESFQEKISLMVPNPQVELVNKQLAEVMVEIKESLDRRRVKGIPLNLRGSPYRASFFPEKVAVVVEGPASILRTLTPADFYAVIEGKGLVPVKVSYIVSPKVYLRDGESKVGVRIISVVPREVSVTISK
jgi:hypothetical protein